MQFGLADLPAASARMSASMGPRARSPSPSRRSASITSAVNSMTVLVAAAISSGATARLVWVRKQARYASRCSTGTRRISELTASGSGAA
ncbi:hypothetical protein ACIP88_02275 [Streptomyces uncialis]|uniref:hypothetical protein n=1 Tax=Streptomyces uncialis TaxID=1048205 RepID=UPI0037F4531D